MMGALPPLDALCAAHHLCWIAASDATGEAEPIYYPDPVTMAEHCANIADEICGIEEVNSNETSDDERAIGFLRCASRLTWLAVADSGESAAATRAAEAIDAAIVVMAGRVTG